MPGQGVRMQRDRRPCVETGIGRKGCGHQPRGNHGGPAGRYPRGGDGADANGDAADNGAAAAAIRNGTAIKRGDAGERRGLITHKG